MASDFILRDGWRLKLKGYVSWLVIPLFDEKRGIFFYEGMAMDNFEEIDNVIGLDEPMEMNPVEQDLSVKNMAKAQDDAVISSVVEGNDEGDEQASLKQSAKVEAKETVLPDAEAIVPDEDVKQEENLDATVEAMRDLGEEFGKIKYLSNEQNLALPEVKREMVNDDEPFSGFAMAGKWLREAFDLRNYWQGIESIGEQVASYKWAYNEGELGEFDGKTFAKEVVKSGLRSLRRDSLRTAGNMLSQFGANMANKSAMTTVMTGGSGLVIPKAGELFMDVGKALRQYADEVENVGILAAPQEMFDEKPSWSKLANVIGSGSAQVLAMGAMSRLIGAGATYGLFATGGAGEMFTEVMDKTGDVSQANVMSGANLAVSFSIDKLFNPLPETIARGAKLTSQKVAHEMLGAPLREVSSEVLQQMLAENLVRKVGLDDTQDLFEGLLESALGAFAGSSMLAGGSGVVYLSGKSLDMARRKILLKGVSREELELYEKNMMALMEQKPEAFEKILSANLKENLRLMDREARAIKNRQDRKIKRGDLKGFDQIYDEMFNRFNSVLGDETKARVVAKVFEANAISLYQQDNSFTPKMVLNELLPQLEKIDVASFLAKQKPEETLSYSLIGINAQKADLNKLTTATAMSDLNVDAQHIWRKTGWHKGGDGKWRMEISDKDAKIMLWGDMELKSGMTDFFHNRRVQMENIKAYLALALRKSAMDGFGAYYQDFYKYLEKNLPETAWHSGDANDGFKIRQDVFEIIDEIDLNRRHFEDIVLQDLLDKYREMHPERKTYATLDEALDELETYKGKTYDFSLEEYTYLMGALEYSRRHEFFKRYWDQRRGVSRNQEFQDLADAKNVQYADNMDYLRGLAQVYHTSQTRRQERSKELERQGLAKSPFFFEDIDKDEAYGRYKLYQGDFSPDMSKEDFYPKSYKEAYRPLTMSEKFLAQEEYKFLKEDQRRLLAGYLDAEEKLFRVDRFIRATELFEKTMRLRFEQAKSGSPYGFFDVAQRQALQSRMWRHRQDMRLGELLDHPELYANYPEIADMTVHFSVLDRFAPYHVYHDAKKGYVLEIDPDYLTTENAKEIFLKGAAFAIQDIEGFDYSLTDDERRNFMNRQIYIAAENIQPQVIENLEEYVDHYLPEVNYREFLIKQDVPLSLIGLSRSADFTNGEVGTDVIKKRAQFYEVDYEKLLNAVKAKYQNLVSSESEAVRDLAYLDLQQVRALNASMIMTEARANGGYSAGLMPWAGITSQGAMDQRALVSRMEYSPEQLAENPFFDETNDLMPVNERSHLDKDKAELYVPDVMDPYDEFAKRIKTDTKNYRQTLEKLAQGAYDSANRTIFLFGTADARTIVHETFHYFGDLLEQVEFRNDTHTVNYREVMSELKEEFVKSYRLKEFDGRWYALNKDTGEIAQELPRGFATRQDVLEAGAREMFVERFMMLLDNRTYRREWGSMGDVGDFYRRWLLTLTNNLEITTNNSSADGARILKFIKNKLK